MDPIHASCTYGAGMDVRIVWSIQFDYYLQWSYERCETVPFDSCPAPPASEIKQPPLNVTLALSIFAEHFVLGTDDFLQRGEEGNLSIVFYHSIVNAQNSWTHLTMGTCEIVQPKPFDDMNNNRWINLSELRCLS